MGFDWSTFVLEIINFLILIWILKRFLYKPVLDVIEQRQAAISKKLQQAEELKSQADISLYSYNNRLSDWEEEKQEAKQALNQEMQQERAARMQQLKEELETERKKAAVIEQRKQIELQHQAENVAISLGARFAAKLFADLSGPEIEQRLIRLFIDELKHVSLEQKSTIQSGLEDTTKEISVQSAYSLDVSDSQLLEAALREIVGSSIPFIYTQDPELIAGVKVTIGAFVLQANLRDELHDFSRFSHDNSTH